MVVWQVIEFGHEQLALLHRRSVDQSQYNWRLRQGVAQCKREAGRRLIDPVGILDQQKHGLGLRPELNQIGNQGEERFLALPDAIRKMTSFPAQRLGLPDRGLLRDGFKADVVVFDAKTVKAPATRTQPKQFPIGIDHVIVNGQVVIDDGRHTGVLAGRALRRGRAST